MSVFLAMTYQMFTNELCQLWSFLVRISQNLHTIYSEVAISHSISECQSNKSGEFAIFHIIGCHGNIPWGIEKKGPSRSSASKTFSFGENIAKIGPSDPEIISLWEIINKKKIKKITEGNLAERAKRHSYYHDITVKIPCTTGQYTNYNSKSNYIIYIKVI